MEILFRLVASLLAICIAAITVVYVLQLLSLRKSQDEGEDAILLKRARDAESKKSTMQGKIIRSAATDSDELAMAGLKLSKAEWLFLRIACSAVCGILAFACIAEANKAPNSPLAAVLAAGIAMTVFYAFKKFLDMRTEKQRLLLEQQLSRMEMQMAENSRSGLSVGRSVLACTELAEEPLKGHLQRLYNEITYSNITLAESFSNLAKRTGSNDAQTLAEVIGIQEKTGSNLADAMVFLHETISRRLEMRRTLRSSLAETKITKNIVAVTPWAIFLLLAFAPFIKINGFWEFYSANPLGWIVLGACSATEAGILLLISRISNLKLD